MKTSDIKNISESVIDRGESVLNWIRQPKEETRNFLIDIVENHKELTTQEKAALMYNSRKFTKEYANSKFIYEQAKKHFNNQSQQECFEEDWLHYFFDKAEKVSNKSMQFIWSKLLDGEFNKPGSVSRKLMHIISIMDVNSAKSFQTFCLYIFERYGLMRSYDTEAAFIPRGFYIDSFDFMLKVEKWLSVAEYSDYKNLAIELTMNTGELNSLENLGLIQKVPEGSCQLPLVYSLEDSIARIVPLEDNELPLGQYSFTQEGKQLYKILNKFGNKAVLIILENYLLSLNKKFAIKLAKK